MTLTFYTPMVVEEIYQIFRQIRVIANTQKTLFLTKDTYLHSSHSFSRKNAHFIVTVWKLLREFSLLTQFWQKFCESNRFSKEITK